MSDSIKHECAVALLRLRKPQEYYAEKYGNGAYGFGKMALLLEKQHNRGQDGAGIASLRLSPRPGEPAFRIEKSAAPSDPLADLLSRCSGKSDFDGQLILGHLRYATFGRQDLSACHPFVHDSSRLRRILLIAGNYNLTNTAELFDKFTRSGHHPSSGADGYLLLETIANCMEDDETVHPDSTDWPSVLRNALREADGAYTLCGMLDRGSLSTALFV